MHPLPLLTQVALKPCISLGKVVALSQKEKIFFRGIYAVPSGKLLYKESCPGKMFLQRFSRMAPDITREETMLPHGYHTGIFEESAQGVFPEGVSKDDLCREHPGFR
jgi:hypothetical protein